MAEISFTVDEGACLAECCTPTIEFCNCELSQATLTISGLTDNEVYLAPYLDYFIPVGSLVHEGGVCVQDSEQCLEISSQHLGGFHLECLLSNLNGAYVANIVEKPGGGWVVSHELGTQDDPNDPGIVIYRYEYWGYQCCDTLDPESTSPPCDFIECADTPFLVAHAVIEVCVYKIEYDLSCDDCWSTTTTRWSHNLDSIVYYRQTVIQSYEFYRCPDGCHSWMSECSGGPVMPVPSTSGWVVPDCDTIPSPSVETGPFPYSFWIPLTWCDYDLDESVWPEWWPEPFPTNAEEADCCDGVFSQSSGCPGLCYEDCSSQVATGKSIEECVHPDCGSEDWIAQVGCWDNADHVTVTIELS